MASYRVVYKGEVLPGFEIDTVRQSAADRLKASAEQIAILFSGRGAILKKGLDAQGGERYIALLQRIGMLAHLEEENPLAPFTIPTPPPAPAPATKPTDFDAESTLVANPSIVTAFAMGGAAAPDADQDNEVPAPVLRAVSTVAPTVIVRRDAQDELPKPSGAALRAAEPTLIVRRDPPEQTAWSSTSPTVVVRRDVPLAEAPRPAPAAAEPTLIIRRDAIPAARAPAEPTMIVRPGSGPQARIVCPQCGLEQVRRMFCERCGHDMSRPVGATDQADIGPETVFVDPNRGAANDAPPPPAPGASKPAHNPHWMIVVAAVVVAAAAAGWFFVLR